MSNRLSGKVCIVTGTAGGIGREAALTFAREGALVVGCGLYVDEAEATLAVSASETMRIGLSNFLEEYLSEIAGVRCGSLFLQIVSHVVLCPWRTDGRNASCGSETTRNSQNCVNCLIQER